jgi:hypothetical protein
MPAEEVKSESAKKNEDWMNSKWRPAMGWMYMAVCMADFVLFPILWSMVQVIGGGKVESQWMPITLQGAGLFHMAMGAILGIAAYGRTQEKLNDKAGGTAPAPTFGAPVATAPSFGGAPSGGNSVGTVPSFGTPAPKPAPTPAFGAPAQPPHPEI